ncbi:MAG: HAD family hydrolase [Cyanobacteria bacterium J06560_6]
MATIRTQGPTSEATFKAVEAVLFDKDGTLANVASYLTALGQARSQRVSAIARDRASIVRSAIMAAFGLSTAGIDPAGLLAVGSRHENEIAAAACLAADLAIAAISNSGWIETLEATKAAFSDAEAALSPKVVQTPLLPDVLPLLHQLKQAGLTIGIVSSDTHAEVATFVSHYQLHDVDWYCGAAPATLAKTHPDFLQFACHALGMSPSATLVIGDSAADYLLSTRGAAGFIGMTGGWRQPVKLPETVATVSALAQIEAFKIEAH